MKDARLWKRILREGLGFGLTAKEKQFINNSGALESVIKAPLVVDTRVRDDVAERGMPWRWKDFRYIAWPFDKFWYEFSTVLKSECGSLIEIGDCVGKPIASNAPHGASFYVSLAAIIAGPATGPTIMGRMAVFLDAQRSLMAEQLENHLHCLPHPNMLSQLGEAETTRFFWTLLDNVLDGLRLLSCKNVSLAPRDNDPEQVRIATKRHGPSATGYRYHVLVVRPPGARSDAPAQEIGNMPRHICRGHFAEYGPEFGKGLLFGKHAGRFYIPPHLKGDAKNGIVEKDYAIRTR